MIARLRGRLLSNDPTCIVEVGGVGFDLQVPEKDRYGLTPGNEAMFFTYLYVREDRLVLFGFLTQDDRDLFIRLIEVSGVGPKIAVNMLGEHATARIVEAIRKEDHAFLCRLPGLGKKTAERLTVELKDKLDHLGSTTVTGAARAGHEVREEVILALTTLGVTRSVAEKAIDKVDQETQETQNVPDIVKEALKHTSAL